MLINIYIINYTYFITQKVVIEVIINLAIRISTIKMVLAESFILKTFDVHRDNMYIKIALIRQYIMVLIKIVLFKPKF